MDADSVRQQNIEIPYRRWFYYLVIGALLTVAEPYFTSRTSRVWTPDIQTYVEVGTI